MKVYHFTSEKYLLDIISDQRLKVSMLDDLNDPFELNAVNLPDQESRQQAKKFKEYMAERYGILCFSKIWRNPLLWSHYANRHKGAAIEFEIKDSVAHSITYRKNRHVLKSGKSYQPNSPYKKEDIKGIWLTKYEDWRYEDEVRVIVEKAECINESGLFFKKLNSEIRMKGLVLGPLCDIEIKSIEESLPAKKAISVIKSRLAFRSFEIVKQEQFSKKTIIEKL